MNVLLLLIPASLGLGLVGLLGFLYLLRSNQYEDPEGQATRVLSDRWDDAPKPDAPQLKGPKPEPPEVR